jgi:hypothetical protein
LASPATASTQPTSPPWQTASSTSSRSCLIAPRRPRPRAHQTRSHPHPQTPSRRRHPPLPRRQRPLVPKPGKQAFDQLHMVDLQVLGVVASLPGARRVGEREPHHPRGNPVHRRRTTRRPRPRRLARWPGRIAGPSSVAIAQGAGCRRLRLTAPDRSTTAPDRSTTEYHRDQRQPVRSKRPRLRLPLAILRLAGARGASKRGHEDDGPRAAPRKHYLTLRDCSGRQAGVGPAQVSRNGHLPTHRARSDEPSVSELQRRR